MKAKTFFMFIILILAACSMPSSNQPIATTAPTEIPSTSPPEPTALTHTDVPIISSSVKPYPDVTSQDTAPEKRAPYGDSYEINRLERPFTQDMTYIPDADIASFGISEDDKWYYVSIEMVGKNPNNAPGIQFSVELDTNADSFGDLLITAEPPYAQDWTAENITIYQDTNRDSAGLSASKSDAVFTGNGYDKLVASIPQNIGNDPDVAWVRMNTDGLATIQIAFKKSFSGPLFLYSVMADAGLKDVSRHDYVDYFTLADAGSPVRDNPNYPLKALFAVDNTCYQAVGFTPTGFEPKICPIIVQPVIAQPRIPGQPPPPPVEGCPDPGNCPFGWAGEPYCLCIPG